MKKKADFNESDYSNFRKWVQAQLAVESFGDWGPPYFAALIQKGETPEEAIKKTIIDYRRVIYPRIGEFFVTTFREAYSLAQEVKESEHEVKH